MGFKGWTLNRVNNQRGPLPIVRAGYLTRPSIRLTTVRGDRGEASSDPYSRMIACFYLWILIQHIPSYLRYTQARRFTYAIQLYTCIVFCSVRDARVSSVVQRVSTTAHIRLRFHISNYNYCYFKPPVVKATAQI